MDQPPLFLEHVAKLALTDGGADLQVGPQPAGLKAGRSIGQFCNVLLVLSSEF
jgi:hypothetical protein